MAASILRCKSFIAISALAVVVCLLAEQASAATPQISSISPASAPAGSGAITLSVRGQNFTEHTVVCWNGTSLPTSCVSSMTIHASISAADLSRAGQAEVTAYSTWTGYTSNQVVFTITSTAASAIPLQITTTTINGWGANCAEGQLCMGADAAGFALLGGAIRPEEIAAGVIQHTGRQPYLSQRAACAPAVFLAFAGDCAPCLEKGTGVRSSRNRTFVQFCLEGSSRPPGRQLCDSRLGGVGARAPGRIA